MNGGSKLKQIEIDLKSRHNHVLTLYVDVYDSSLANKWYQALTELVANHYHLENNYCFY